MQPPPRLAVFIAFALFCIVEASILPDHGYTAARERTGRRLLAKKNPKQGKSASPSPSPSPSPKSSPTPSPSPSPKPSPSQPSGGGGIALTGGRCPDVQATFDAANTYRRAHGARALQWDSALASDSQTYAAVLAAQTCALQHTDQSGLPAASRFGENLYMAGGYPNVSYTCKSAVDSWYSEVTKYKFTSTPYTDNFVLGGATVGHFTQLVWNATGTVGCGFATGPMPFPGYGTGACKMVVCRFRLPGNALGSTSTASNSNFLKNVFPKIQSTTA